MRTYFYLEEIQAPGAPTPSFPPRSRAWLEVSDKNFTSFRSNFSGDRPRNDTILDHFKDPMGIFNLHYGMSFKSARRR